MSASPPPSAASDGSTPGTRPRIDRRSLAPARRTLLGAAGWAVPAVALTASAPSASASPGGPLVVDLAAVSVSMPSPNSGTRSSRAQDGIVRPFRAVLKNVTYVFTAVYENVGSAVVPPGTGLFDFSAGRALDWQTPTAAGSASIMGAGGASTSATTVPGLAFTEGGYRWGRITLDAPLLPGDSVTVGWSARLQPTVAPYSGIYYHPNPASIRVTAGADDNLSNRVASSGNPTQPPTGWYAAAV